MKGIIAVGASVLSLALASHASAQSVTGDEETTPPPVTGESAGISEIVVTATRQATNMQDTPIAITAVTAKDLEVRGL